MTSLVGTHKARAKEWDLGISSNGNEQIAVLFEITEGEHAGKCRTWFGSFSDAAIDRTLDAMRHCGWDGDSLATIDGLGANDVEIVIEVDEYNGKVSEKIRWVNKPMGLKLKHQLTGPARDAFASKLRGKVIAHKQKYGTQPAARPGPKPVPHQYQSRAAVGESYSGYDDAAPPPSDDDY